MKINVFRIIFLATIFAAPWHAYAFEKQSIVFQQGQATENKVSVVFEGLRFKPPLPVLNDKKAVDPEVNELKSFFKRFYDQNKSGDKTKILELWAKVDRPELEKLMTPEALEQNASRFGAIQTMNLKKVILYGDYYICSIENIYAENQKIVLNYALIRKGKQYLITNALAADHFYAQVVPTLDDANFYNR